MGKILAAYFSAVGAAAGAAKKIAEAAVEAVAKEGFPAVRFCDVS